MKNEMRKLRDSFRAAFVGIWHAMHERNFRIHMVMTVYVLFFSFLAHVGIQKFSILCICIGLVLAAELLNSAIESLCDRITRDYDADIGKIKDLAAGTVLVLAIAAAAVGLVIFLSRDIFYAAIHALLAPYILIPFLISIPIALLFIFKFK